jgi:hypothetical protein
MDRLFLGKIIKEIKLSSRSLPLLMSRNVSLVFSLKGKRPRIHLKSSSRMLIAGGVNYTEIEFENLDKIIKALMLFYGINKSHQVSEMTVEELRALFEEESAG